MPRPSSRATDETLLTLDPAERSRFKQAHNFGFNTCHAPIAMRSDVQEQMTRARQELGMRFWRCHATLGDGVGIVTRTGRGRLEYTFSGLKRILAAGLRCGVKPFLELSFMPSALARDPGKTITHYRGITSPPKSWKEWGALIDRLIRFLLETYGAAELRQWYFEVWNEPNIPFWEGTKEEYFQLYRVAALAIKKADGRLRVGGPATARAAWVGDLLRFCRTTRTPIDFTSTHIYPSDVAFVDAAEGEVKLLGTDYLRDAFRAVRREVDAHDRRLPIFWGEWNSSAGPLAENHDTCNNAALICSALAGIEEFADGSLYWNLSDIYEECRYHFAPFHGGYGLYTVDGVAKSSARAFELWQGLRGDRIAVRGLPETASRGAFATQDGEGGALGMVLWNHAEPGRRQAPWKVALQLDGPRPTTVTLDSVRPGHGSAYEIWVALGRPLNLNPGARRRLEAASRMGRRMLAVDGTGRVRLSLAPGEAVRIAVAR